MSKKTIKFLGLVIALVVVVTVWMNGSGEKEETGIKVAQTDLLLRGNSGEPGTLDPHKSRKSVEIIIIGDLFEGLMAYDAKGNVIFGAASDYSISEDGLKWTFSLREGLKWSDGVAITSADFLYSFRRAMLPETASPTASLLYSIKNSREVNTGDLPVDQLGVSAPDELTLVFELEQPTPYFDLLLRVPAALPVPKHVIDVHGPAWTRPPNAVSNGAFKLIEWKPRVHVQVEKNEHFHDYGSLQLAGVKYLPTEDLTTQLKRFRAGELDIGLNFPPSQTEWVKENLKDAIQIFPIYGTYYYPFNLASEKLSDVRTRKALNMAIDREMITSKLLGSGEIPTYSFMPGGFKYYPESKKPDYASLSMQERQQQAIQLLAEVGFDKTKPLTLEVRYNMTEEHQAIAVAVASMWKAVGINVELLSTETRSLYKDLAIGEFEVGRMGMFPNYPDISGVMQAFLSYNQSENYSGYSNPEFDRMFAEANSLSDPQLRAEMFYEVEQLALSDYPILPIYHYVSKRLISPRVKGWHNNPTGSHPSRYFWLEDTENKE